MKATVARALVGLTIVGRRGALMIGEAGIAVSESCCVFVLIVLFGVELGRVVRTAHQDILVYRWYLGDVRVAGCRCIFLKLRLTLRKINFL